MEQNYDICVIGLGYVGLPLAVALSKKYYVSGIDTDANRISCLENGIDNTNEFEPHEIENALKSGLKLSSIYLRRDKPTVFIVTVPTPVSEEKLPDLQIMHSACSSIGQLIKKGDIVVFESTVYPGATREEFIPIIENVSHLIGGKDFYFGYSPERINPSDKLHKIQNIVKVVSGCSPRSLAVISEIYSKIVEAGIYQAESVEVAEAAKVIENTQRDINIAFMNEVSLILHALNINTKQVLKAASTKWNFLQFNPGLVGGHCIGVDPYYIIHKSKEHGYYPALISTGRKTNESMGNFVVLQLLKCAEIKNISLQNKPVLILGATFKPDCPDLRNSKVEEICDELNKVNVKTFIFDPVAYERKLGKHTINNKLTAALDTFSAVILAVPHLRLVEFVDEEFSNGKHAKIFFDLYSACRCNNHFEL